MSHITRNQILILLFSIVGLSMVISFLTWKSNVSITFLTIGSAFSLLLAIAIKDVVQVKHSLLKNYPLIGRFRWMFEHERTKIQQYFVENDIDGTPYNREKRSDVYQKAKGELNTTPFGTQLNVYKDGYEFTNHSMYPKDLSEVEDLRVTIGSPYCRQPYSASVVNISAMSFGALSDAAIISLNNGSKMGKFYHNTGEGGISEHHLQGGDLCFQIGTGYFGAGKTIDGRRVFNEDMFYENASRPEVKLIEIKMSQGSKPGLGGILPAKKNTPEIAKIRGIDPGVEVISPPYHSAYSDAQGLLEFIKKLRRLSGGKPIGIKMCVGDQSEIDELISLMAKTTIYPDFITIDGSEGGTGSAPLSFTNYMGTPLVEGLTFMNETLTKYGIRKYIKIIASGKASGAFDVVKIIALGADIVNIARAFMLSMGCIQARECNSNTCPVGVATQNPALVKGLDPTEKSVRVYNYHKNLIYEVREFIGAMGLTSTTQLKPSHIKVRKYSEVKSYGNVQTKERKEKLLHS